MIEAIKNYKDDYSDQGKDEATIGADYFRIVIQSGRGRMGHYFIAHGEQGNDFRENDTISFMVGQVSVATATLAERVEGAHGDDGGDRFFYLTDLKVTE